jgi:parallel beta-helix repeat protein
MQAQDLKLLGNAASGVFLFSGNDNAVVNCFIIGPGNGLPGSFGILVRSGSGDLVKDNQISETAGGIDSTSSGCAIIHNYVANSFRGLDLSTSDYYQGNVATGCHFPFTGGNAIGAENGGN